MVGIGRVGVGSTPGGLSLGPVMLTDTGLVGVVDELRLPANTNGIYTPRELGSKYPVYILGYIRQQQDTAAVGTEHAGTRNESPHNPQLLT